MISILSSQINNEINKLGKDKKYVINSLPERTIIGLENAYKSTSSLPWIILDNNTSNNFSPSESFNSVFRYVEDDITAFRTYYTGKKGFLLIVPPGINYQGSLDTTMNLIDELFEKVEAEVLKIANIREDEKELVKKCISVYLKQSFNPTDNNVAVAWQILEIVHETLNLKMGGIEGAISALGFFRGTNIENISTSISLINRLAQIVYEKGITNAFKYFGVKASNTDLTDVIPSLEKFEKNIQANVADAVNFHNTPHSGTSNANEKWWQDLDLDAWKILLGDDEPKDPEFKINIVSDNQFTLHSNLALILGGIVDFEVIPNQPVEWELNKNSIESASDFLSVGIDDLDEVNILQEITVQFITGRKKSLKFLHFDKSLFPIGIDCGTALKIAQFKKAKNSNEFTCEIQFQAMGQHTLEFYYNNKWNLGEEIISNDNSPDHDNDQSTVVKIAPLFKNGNQVNRAQAEIFADESCSFRLNVTDPGGTNYVINIKANSNDGEVLNVRSFYESLVVENLRKKDLSSKPRIVVPPGIYNLERLLVKNKQSSFNPIAVGPDLATVINQVEERFDPKQNTILSSSFMLDPAFEKRPKPIQNNNRFEKLINLRSEIIDLLFKPDDYSLVTSFIEPKNLSKILSSSPEGTRLLNSYFEEFEALLNVKEVPIELTWFDTIVLYWEKPKTTILDQVPYAVFLSPFHPISLGWQVKVQDMLIEALDKKMHCPIAGMFSPSHIPSSWFLPFGNTSKIEFVSTRTNLDYWRVFWNKDKLGELGNSKMRSFLKSLNIEIDNSSISLSSTQITKSLNQIKFLLPSANHYKVGVIGNDTFQGFNSGVENWINEQFVKGEKESKEFDNVWKKIVPTSLDIFDYRDQLALPQNDVLNNLVNEKNIHLNWYRVNEESNDSTVYDLGVVAKLETDNAELDHEPLIVDSILGGNGTLRIEYNLNSGNAIIEPKKISSTTEPHDRYEALILNFENFLFNKTGKNAYKHNPGLLSLTNFINKSRYSVVSSSGLDLSYILNYEKGKFKLWDYELPKYGKTLNSQDGYYMVSSHNFMHTSVIQDAIMRLTGTSMNEEECNRLLDWMNSLGILSLKNLATGGAMAISEIGILVTHLLIQPSLIRLPNYNGLYPVTTSNSVNLLIPIDPFRERIDMLKTFTNFEKNKRPDFLLLQFDSEDVGKICISPIEVKTRNGELSKSELDNAIEQAESFKEFLEKLESFQSGEIEIWKFVLPVLLWEMTRFSIGLQTSKELIGRKEVELVRNTLELLNKGKARIQYCHSWVFSISERNVTESFVQDNRCNIVAIKKRDILPLLECNWQSFYKNCKNGFLQNIMTCSQTEDKKSDNTSVRVDTTQAGQEGNMNNLKPIEEKPTDGNAPNNPTSKKETKRDQNLDLKWEHQYKDILSILNEHGVKLNDVTVDKIVQGPAFVTYKIEPGRGVKVSSIEKLHDELKLGLKLREDQRIRFKVDGGVIKIEVPKFEDDRYFITAKDIWNGWKENKGILAVPIGENQEGDIIIMNFSSDNAPHLLIGGSTGSGKSEALNTILHGLCKFKNSEELKLLLVDPKGTELVDFENSKHLLFDIGFSPEDAVFVLEKAVKEMQDRYEIMKEKKVNKITKYNSLDNVVKLPWWLIVLDEYGDLTSIPEDKKIIEFNLKRLAQKARAAGIHIIITTQKPSAEVISTNIRSNLGAQLALKVRGSAESKVILDKTGAEALNGKGDALFFDGVKLNRIQVALVKK